MHTKFGRHCGADVEASTDGFTESWAKGSISSVHEPKMGWGAGGLYFQHFTCTHDMRKSTYCGAVASTGVTCRLPSAHLYCHFGPAFITGQVLSVQNSATIPYACVSAAVR